MGGESQPRDRNAPPGAPARERGSAWRTKKWEAPPRVGIASAPAAWGGAGAVVRGKAGLQRTGSRGVREPERRGRRGVNIGRKEPGARLSLSRKITEQETRTRGALARRRHPRPEEPLT